MDLTKTYGPFYGGMLQQQMMNQQSAATVNDSSTRTLGLLSQIAQQNEQQKLIQQQVELAKLKAIKEGEKQDMQKQFFQMFMGGGEGQQPQMQQGPGPTSMDVNPTLAAPQASEPSAGPSGGLLNNPNFLAAGQVAGIDLTRSGQIAQKQYEHNTLSAKDREDVRLREQAYQLDMEKLRADLYKWGNLSPVEKFNTRARLIEMRDKGIIPPNEADPLLQQTAPNAQPQAGPPQAGEPSMQVQPSVQRGRDDLRLRILQDERAAEAANGNAANVANLDREIAMVQGKRPAPAAPAQAAPQGPQPLNVPPDVRRKLEAERPAATAAYRTTTSSLSRLEQAATDLANNPGLPGISGIQGRVFNIPGGKAANAEAALSTLKSQIFITTLQAMRAASPTGGAVGNVTEKEGGRLENALSSLEKAQSHQQLRASLLEIANIARGSKASITEAFDMTYPTQREQVIPPGQMYQDLQRGSGSRVVDFNKLGR